MATSYSSKSSFVGVTVKARTVSPGGSRRSSGTKTSITNRPPGSRCAATLRKHATCSSCVVRFVIVLKTRYTRPKVPSTVVVAKSPIVTPTSSPPGLARIRATIASDRSIPCTATPRRAERQRDATGADPELEGAPASRQVGEEVHGGVDHLGLEHLGGPGVVPCGDLLVEVPG